MKPIAIPNRESSCGVNPERWVDDHRDCLFRYALLRVRRPEVGARSRLERQPTDFRQNICYFGDRTLGPLQWKSEAEVNGDEAST